MTFASAQVNKRIDAYGEMKWKDLTDVFEEIKEEVEGFEKKCSSLNKGLRSWQAYIDLKNKIDNFRELQPLLEDLSNRSIMQPRHWREIMDITGATFNMDEDVFKLQDVLDANLLVCSLFTSCYRAASYVPLIAVVQCCT